MMDLKLSLDHEGKVSLGLTIPFPEISLSKKPVTSKLELTIEKIEFLLQKILNDQFLEENTPEGAWGKSYQTYLDFYFGKEIPGDIGQTSSITFSSWIFEPMFQFYNQEVLHDVKILLYRRFLKYRDFLVESADLRRGGFGKWVSNQSKTGVIASDPRHTIWGLNSLLKLLNTDFENAELRRTWKTMREKGDSIRQLITSSLEFDDYSITYASGQYFAASESLTELVGLSERESYQLRIQFESRLVNIFKHDFFRWDNGTDLDPRLGTIDNLLILQSINSQVELSEDLKTIICLVLSYLDRNAIASKKNQLGISIGEEGISEIGSTIQTYHLFQKFSSIFTLKQERLEKYKNYISDISNYVENGITPYTWHIGNIFYYI